MKKLIFTFSAITILGAGMFSCKKEKFLQNNLHSNRASFSEDGLDRIPIIDITASLEELMQNAEDLDEEKLNYQLYDLAEATRALIQNDEFKNLILHLAREFGHGEVYYSEIKNHAIEFYDQINDNLAEKGLSIESITANMTHSPTNPNPEYPETAELEIYEPVIYVPNYQIADNNAKTLISPNVEVLHDDEDYIVVWYYTNDHEVGQTIINEQTALNTTNPIFILNHGVKKEVHDAMVAYLDRLEHSGPIMETRPGAPIGGPGLDIVCDEFRIKNGYRHETGPNNKSEFCVVATVIYSDTISSAAGGAPLFYGSGVNNDGSIKLKKVTPSDVASSTWQTNIGFMHTPDLRQLWYERIYWNSFERDWNRGNQPLGNGTIWGKPWHIFGRMRYANDWYAFIPNTVAENHHLDYWWFVNGAVVNFDNWKNSYKLYRSN